MAFLTESRPVRGHVMEMTQGIRRIVADNPGPMTYHGTNTYLLEGPDGVSVLDPGPDDAVHLQVVLEAAGSVARILVSHGHADHVAGLAAMRGATGAPVYAFMPSLTSGLTSELTPDHGLADGDEIAGWTVLHTPGHAPDHLCLARGDGVVMTADHVMGWSTSVVSPPDGDMAAYFAGLQRLLDRRDRLFLPGHGPAIVQPQDHVRFLLEHRTARERAILAALAMGPRAVSELVDALYMGIEERLRGAATRNVLAHLIKLEGEARAVREGALWVIP